MIGLYDTRDNVWLGTSDGPTTYPDESPELARMAAMMVVKQLGWPRGRVEARPLPPGINTKRDELPVLKDPMTALDELERGI